jgi:hypothetical protein
VAAVSGRCGGLHCPGCGHGGGGGALVVVLVVLAILGAVVHVVWHQLVEAAQVVVDVAEITVLTVLGVAGLAAIAGIGYGAVRVRQRMLSRRERQPAAIVISSRPAIEPPGHSWPLPGQWEEIRPRIGRDE